jgi:hypothetical protein
LSGLLETCGNVYGVPGREPLLGAHDDLSCVHSHAHLQRHAVVALEFFIEERERLAELRGSAHRSQCIVLVHGRDAEDRHHRVPDELLDRGAVALEAHPRRLEVPCHHAAQRLGVETLAERG